MGTHKTRNGALLAEKRQNKSSSPGCPGAALQADAGYAEFLASKRAISAPSGIDVAIDTPVTIRIVATIIHDNGVHGVAVDYMGARFTAPSNSLVERVDKQMALFELPTTIIRSTGRASFLVAYQGHSLRVHVQQMREAEVLA